MSTQEEVEMAMFIIMTSAEANIVRQPLTTINPRYASIQRAEEKWILPKSILASVNHAAYHEFLGELPQLDHNDPAFPGPYEPPVE